MKLFQKYFTIPLAIGVSIDDAGWRESEDLRETTGGPPRLNGSRNSTIDDYNNLSKIANMSGTRLMTAFIISDFDKENTLKKPSYNKPKAPINITEFGTNWNNIPTSKDIEIMKFMKNNAHSLELGLHGVRHGHYGEGKWISSEWADIKNATPWDPENNTSHLIAQAFTDILRQYFKEDECSFPESFVPPNHAYFYKENNPYTTGAILGKYGIKYATLKASKNNPCHILFRNQGKYDHKVFVMDRRSLYGVGHRKHSFISKFQPRSYAWIETHFNNFFGIPDKWAEYLYNINNRLSRMLAKNSEHICSQWHYKKFAKVKNLFKKAIIIDNTNMIDEAYKHKTLSSLTIKTYLGNQDIIYATIDKGASIFAYYKDKFGYGYLQIGYNKSEQGALEKEIYTLSYEKGVKNSKKTKDFIYIDNSLNTFNLYSLESKDSKIQIKMKLYGNQVLQLKLPAAPNKVISHNKNLTINSFDYTDNTAYINMSGKNIIGETGIITIEY